MHIYWKIFRKSKNIFAIFSWMLDFYYYVFVVGNCTQILLTEGVQRSSDEFSVNTIVEYRCVEGK